MNIGIFSSPVQPVLFNYIRTWSELPAAQFALAPEDVSHILINIRAYIDSADNEVGINVPLTATRHYLRQVEGAKFRLIKSLGFDPHSLNYDFKGGELSDSLTHRRIVDDLSTLHQVYSEALGLVRIWQGLTAQLYGRRDIHSTAEQPPELPPCVSRLQHHLLSRIGLANKAYNFAFLQVGSNKKRMVTHDGVQKAIDAFFDDGQRAEFDAIPLAASLQIYLSV